MTNPRKAASNSVITLHALGSCVIQTPRERLTPNHEVVFAAALYLILERGKRVARTTLENLLWPELANSDTAHHRLRQTLLKMKQAGIPINSDRISLFLPIDSCEVDAEVLLIGNLAEELPLVGFLSDYVPVISVDYSHWLDERKRQTNTALVRRLLEQIESARATGAWSRVEILASHCMVIDPFNDEAVLARAEAVALRGGKREAISLLDSYLDELGDAATEVRIPASIMRRRISEHLTDERYGAGISSFVGRDEQMGQLTSFLNDSQRARGRSVLIYGIPGIGKSRLSIEIARFAELQGVCVKRMKCQPSDSHRPLSIFSDIVPALLQVRGAIGCNEETLKYLRLLNESGRASSEITGEAEIVYKRVREALFDLFDAITDEQCLLFLIDDLQWLDKTSADLLLELSEWSIGRRLMLLLVSRDPCPSWISPSESTVVESLELRKLDDRASHKILAALTTSGARTPDDELNSWFVRIADGNPYFLQELVRHWLETGRSHSLPPALDKILRERVSRLSPIARHVLQACALLGKYSTIERLTLVLQYRNFELLSAFEELGRHSMITLDVDSSSSGITITRVNRHDLLSSAVLGNITSTAKLFLHRKIGEVLETDADTNNSPALMWDCAIHWQEAGDSHRALGRAQSCAEHLTRIGLYSESARILEQAMAFCPTREEKIDNLERLINVLPLAGEWKSMIGAIETFQSLQCEIDNAFPAHSALELLRFEALWRSSANWRDLLGDLTPCTLNESAEPMHRVAAGILAMKFASNVALPDKMDGFFATIEPLLHSTGIPNAMAYEAEMIFHTDRGDIDRACDVATALINSEEASGSTLRQVRAMQNAAHVFRRASRTSDASQVLERAYTMAVSSKLLLRATLVAQAMVQLWLEVGDVELASAWYAKVDESLLSFDDLHSLTEYRLTGARIALLKSDISAAERLFSPEFYAPKSDQSLLRRLCTVAILIQMRIAKNSRESNIEALVEELEHGHCQVRSTGGQDFETTALVRGLVYLGSDEQARDILADYVLKYRREKGPLSPELRIEVDRLKPLEPRVVLQQKNSAERSRSP